MLTIKVESKLMSFFKFGPICFLCPKDQILRRTLTCEEVPGSSVVILGDDLEKKGFICDTCLVEVRNDEEIVVIQ